MHAGLFQETLKSGTALGNYGPRILRGGLCSYKMNVFFSCAFAGAQGHSLECPAPSFA